MSRVSRLDRLTLLATLALLTINIATTGRWAHVPGALRGWRWPYLAVAIAVTAFQTVRPPSSRWVLPRWIPRAVVAGGVAMLAGSFLFEWLPPSSWSQIPFLDDWPSRFLSTVQGVQALRHGAFIGWQWNSLGGYSTAADLSQPLTLLGAVPMMIFGNAVGFHLLHLLLFLAIPALVFIDLNRTEPRRVVLMATGLSALAACGMGWLIIRSGDTNSVAGLVAVLGAMTASHRLRAGGRYGMSLLVLALTVAAYSHLGFFLYASGLLVVEALYYRSARQLHRSLIAAGLAFVISLPVTYEIFRYPATVNFNTVMYAPPTTFDWAGIVRKIGYNIQILFLPWRWFNDPGGLASLFMPLVLVAAWRRDGRIGYYAWAALAIVALLRLNVPEAGFLFIRPVLLLIVFVPIVIAWVVSSLTWDRWQAVGLLCVAALSFQIVWITVPHLASVDQFVPALVDHIKTLDGHLIVLENNPHRDVDASPASESEPSLYGTHYESLIPEATGKELYSAFWDGYPWVPFRGEALQAGAWEGHALTDADHDAFLAEMHRWGVRHVLVWSRRSKAVLPNWPEFAMRWEDGPWRDFVLTDPNTDVRAVVTPHGSGELLSPTPRGAVVRLDHVQSGDVINVRTHFHPSWEAFAGSQPVSVEEVHGQVGFVAPSSGSYDVTLVYPARRWLLAMAAGVIVLLVLFDRRFGLA